MPYYNKDPERDPILTTTHMGCRVPERSEGLGVPRRGIDALVWAEPPKSRLLLSL